MDHAGYHLRDVANERIRGGKLHDDALHFNEASHCLYRSRIMSLMEGVIENVSSYELNGTWLPLNIKILLYSNSLMLDN